MQIGEVFVDEYPAEAAEWCNENDCRLEHFVNVTGGDSWRIVKTERAAETPEQTQARYTEAAQDALDTFARTRGYDGIMSACSYANSTDTQFHAEAEYCIILRDQTWRRAYAILAAVLAGTMEMPSVDDFLAMLPVSAAAWPDAEQGDGDAEDQ